MIFIGLTPAAAARAVKPFTVYLTFDDGPKVGWTDKILDVLKKYDVKATFFVQGSNISAGAYLVRRELAEGHRIGSHLWQHSREIMAGAHPATKTLMDRYHKWQAAMKAALGDAAWAQYDSQAPKIMRWPGGATSPFPMGNMITYNWQVSSGDDVVGVSVSRLVNNTLHGFPAGGYYGVYDWGDGTIVLMHDTGIIASALPRIIEDLRAHGAVFGVLPRPGDSPGSMPIRLGAIPPCAKKAGNCTKEDMVAFTTSG